VVGGLLGPGYWLCGAVWDTRPSGKSTAEVHFTEFVLASIVVVIASWGLLLILGEALLFTLAIFRAYDKEQYDIYRNLMILWGYVLTLGIPRHFRKLPAQFGALNDDALNDARGRSHRDGDRRTAERPPTRDQRHRRDAMDARDGRPYREDPRDHTGCQNRAPDRGGPWDHEDVRDHTPCRERTSPGRRRASSDPPGEERLRDVPVSGRRREDERSLEHEDAPRRERVREGRRRRTGDRRVAGAPERDGTKRPADPGAPPEKPAAALGAVPHNPLGPIFPPRPAAEAGPTPIVPVTPVAPTPPGGGGPGDLPAPVVAASLADALATAGTIPANAGAELRDALGVLLRYAARLGTAETPPPSPAQGGAGTLGIAAEAAGGDV
jgi:hypothetical protein